MSSSCSWRVDPNLYNGLRLARNRIEVGVLFIFIVLSYKCWGKLIESPYLHLGWSVFYGGKAVTRFQDQDSKSCWWIPQLKPNPSTMKRTPTSSQSYFLQIDLIRCTGWDPLVSSNSKTLVLSLRKKEWDKFMIDFWLHGLSKWPFQRRSNHCEMLSLRLPGGGKYCSRFR